MKNETNEQSAWSRLHPSGQPAESGQKTPFFILPAAGMLILGLAGVLFFGPSKAVEAVQGFIGGTKKSAAATDASPDPVLPEKSAKAKRRARAQEKAAQMTDLSSIAPLRHSPIPAPVQVDARQSPRSARIIAGMTRADLVALWGAPDIKTTAVVHGRLTETYSYGYRPHSPARLMILEEGRVISTGDISTP